MDRQQFQALAFAHGLSEEALLELCTALEKWGWKPSVDLEELSEPGPNTLVIDERGPPTTISLTPISPNDEHTEIDRYIVQGKLGEGGMGEVYRVFDPRLNRHLALKCISSRIMDYEHAVTRFIEEAQLTSQLHHPGIVPVHDFGRLPSGQYFFTMPVIQGRTLSSLIKEKFNKKNDKPSLWTRRRIMELFRQACDTIGYAHARGVIHCDLKPDNIMVGKFGEVYVLDWGVAQTLGRVSELPPVEIRIPGTDPINTSFTPMMGTPQYMAPEQAEGKHEDLNQQTDVYSLGLVLYQILCGKRAYKGSGTGVLEKVKKGELEPIDGPLPIPEALKEICEKATQFNAVDRYQDAGELATDLANWLDGIKKQERAMKLVVAAKSKLPEADKLSQEAEVKHTEAQAILSLIDDWAPEKKKWEGWAKEDEAIEMELKAQHLELEFTLMLHGALSHDPDLVEAHRYLADYYQASHMKAEEHQDSNMIQRNEGMLRLHANALPDTNISRVRHMAYLKGDGALTILTNPEKANVILYRCERKNRRLIPVKFKEMQTPIYEIPIPCGSYIAEISAPGRTTVRYPVRIDRLGHWDGVPPDGDWPESIWLPPKGHLADNDIYVPRGWFWYGSDPMGGGALGREKIWVDSFVIKKHPVTNTEYMAFLNDLLDQGREELALKVAPREKQGISAAESVLVYARDDNGRFHLTRDSEGDLWQTEWPTLMIDWHSARAYADWVKQKTGYNWRLPYEVEWEKSCRGADSRIYPWGNEFETSRCNNRYSAAVRSLPSTIDKFPVDCSPYGVMGMAGNSSDWCLDIHRKHPLVENHRMVKEVIVDDPQVERVMRGGSWDSAGSGCRISRRNGNIAITRLASLGARICRSVNEDSEDAAS